MPEKYCFIEILGVTNYREGRQLCKNHFHPNDIKISKNGSTCREMLYPNHLPGILQWAFLEIVPGDAWIVT